MIDTHCHILPGLDDGARDMETALEMARIAHRDGIRAIIATPHVNLETCLPSRETIRARTAELSEALAREGIEVAVHAGAEHALSGDLLERLRAGELMTLADRGKHLLVELPFGGYPAFVSEVFFSLQLAGVTPVLAHPERAAAGRTELEPAEVYLCLMCKRTGPANGPNPRRWACAPSGWSGSGR